jgi:HlyD family secretion protein
MRGSAPQAVVIHTGLSDGTVTEVVDGDLKEGDVVVVDTLNGDGSASSAPTSTSTSTRRLF